MLELLQCGIVLVICFCLFYVFGKTFCEFFSVKKELFKTITIGFFLYYGCFQLIALPCILLKQSLTLLTILWSIVLVIMIVFVVYKKIKQHDANKLSIDKIKKKIIICWESKIYIVVLVLIVYQCLFAMFSTYIGWDTAYYIGNINTSLYTDTMYIYNGTSGVMEGALPLRYAMSGFYMNSAVWCRLFNVEAILMQRYIVTAIGQLETMMVVYLIAQKLFSTSKQIGCFLIAYIGYNFLFITKYSSASFLLERGYEAKSFCANLLILATIYGYLCLRENIKDINNWRLFFVIVSSSIPISMSAILLIPVLVVTLVLMLFYENRQLIVLRNGIICLIPNIIYVLIYVLNVAGIFVLWLGV